VPPCPAGSCTARRRPWGGCAGGAWSRPSSSRPSTVATCAGSALPPVYARASGSRLTTLRGTPGQPSCRASPTGRRSCGVVWHFGGRRGGGRRRKAALRVWMRGGGDDGVRYRPDSSARRRGAAIRKRRGGAANLSRPERAIRHTPSIAPAPRCSQRLASRGASRSPHPRRRARSDLFATLPRRARSDPFATPPRRAWRVLFATPPAPRPARHVGHTLGAAAGATWPPQPRRRALGGLVRHTHGAPPGATCSPHPRRRARCEL